jgi:hypothetical protein
LTAVPAEGWSFSGWSGDLSGGVNPGSVTMDGNKAVVATFTQNKPDEYTVSASVDGVGGTIDPSGLVTVNAGETITFTLTPDDGYHILNVLVDGVYMGPQGSFTFYEIDSDHNITAIFAMNEYALTIVIVGPGRVTTNPNKISYSYGEAVLLTAVPNNKNFIFAYWGGDLTGTNNSQTIVMNGDKTVYAYFTKPPR